MIDIVTSSHNLAPALSKQSQDPKFVLHVKYHSMIVSFFTSSHNLVPTLSKPPQDPKFALHVKYTTVVDV